MSRFKFDILQLSLTFLDFLIIDRDTFSFLLSVFPRLKMPLLVAAVAAVPVLWLIWRTDPFRVSRRFALREWLRRPYRSRRWHWQSPSSRGSRSRASITFPTWRDRAWSRCRAWPRPDGSRPIRRRTARSASRAARTPPACLRCRAEACDATVKRPHIIMLLDESSFDVRAAPGIKVPAGYADYFKSGRRQAAHHGGGGDRRSDLVHRVQHGDRAVGALVRRPEVLCDAHRRGQGDARTAAALQRCGYKTVSLYPTYGDFLGARTFQKAAGVEQFIDMAEMGVNEDMQPDSFYFDQALKVFARELPPRAPVFMYLYLTANHFPWWTSTGPS